MSIKLLQSVRSVRPLCLSAITNSIAKQSRINLNPALSLFFYDLKPAEPVAAFVRARAKRQTHSFTPTVQPHLVAASGMVNAAATAAAASAGCVGPFVFWD